jgi:hypothetical protein
MNIRHWRKSGAIVRVDGAEAGATNCARPPLPHRSRQISGTASGFDAASNRIPSPLSPAADDDLFLNFAGRRLERAIEVSSG